MKQGEIVSNLDEQTYRITSYLVGSLGFMATSHFTVLTIPNPFSWACGRKIRSGRKGEKEELDPFAF
jgi:hypothetical protein